MSIPRRFKQSVMSTGVEVLLASRMCPINKSICSIIVGSKSRIALSLMACPMSRRFTLCWRLSRVLNILGFPAALVSR